MPRALLFDLDGTLADTDPLHRQAWGEVLAGHPPEALLEAGALGLLRDFREALDLL